MMMIEQMSYINNKNHFNPETVLEILVEMRIRRFGIS